MIRASFAFAIITLLGCQGILDIEEGQGRGGGDGVGGSVGGSGPSGGSGGTEVCATGSCSPLPVGWSGPLVFRLADQGSSCPIGWQPNATLKGGTNPTGDPFLCTCSCGTPTGFECPTSILIVSYSPESDCQSSTTGSTLTTTDGMCQDVAGTFTQSFLTGPLASTLGVCETTATPTDTPPAEFLQYVVACDAESPATCDDGLCLDAPDDFQRCVWRQGTGASCPMDYPDEVLVHASIDDQRACECSECGVPGAGECGVTVELFDAITCNQSMGAGSGCVDTSLDSNYASVRATLDGTTTATCTPGSSNAIGEVSGADPLTVCCAP